MRIVRVATEQLRGRMPYANILVRATAVVCAGGRRNILSPARED